MAKQSILGRISQLLRANINALLDQAEDPQLMLDQLVRDYTNSIAEAESAVAQTIGNLRLMEQDHDEDVDAAADWGRKALAASAKGDELRAAGNTADADKFDKLAKMAIGKQISAENEAKTAEPTIASQNEVVDKLKAGIDGMQREAQRAHLEARRAGRPRQDRAGAEPGRRRAAVDRRARPDQRARPLRRQGPPRGGARRRQAGARRVVARLAVRVARGPRQGDRGRGPPRRAEGRRRSRKPAIEQLEPQHRDDAAGRLRARTRVRSRSGPRHRSARHVRGARRVRGPEHVYDGRSAILFATVAGVSLGLLTGGAAARPARRAHAGCAAAIALRGARADRHRGAAHRGRAIRRSP